MKEIKEEWKVIEEFPDYEISNYGKCRKISANIILKPMAYGYLFNRKRKYYGYTLFFIDDSGNRKGRKRLAGKLVAKAFVPNPHGFKQIKFKDGNTNNLFYMNIEWVKCRNPSITKYIPGGKTIEISTAIKYLKEQKEYSERLIDALENNTIELFAEEYCRPLLSEYAKLVYKTEETANDFVDFGIARMTDLYKRGYVKSIPQIGIRGLHMMYKESRKKNISYNPILAEHNPYDYENY